MVFIIQQARNKDTVALQLELDELIAATKGASNLTQTGKELHGR